MHNEFITVRQFSTPLFSVLIGLFLMPILNPQGEIFDIPLGAVFFFFCCRPLCVSVVKNLVVSDGYES